jgi:hypothetical protein
MCIADLQNSTECLAAFVREGSEALLEWGGDADQTMPDSVARYILRNKTLQVLPLFYEHIFTNCSNV